MSPHCTHAKNTSQHPGQIILDTQVKRHTVAEKQADNQCLAEVQATRRGALTQAYQQIATIKDRMEATQKVRTSVKPVQPCPRVITQNAAKGSTVPAVGMLSTSVTAEVDDGDGGDSDAVSATASITPKITGKKSSNTMLREAISTARMKYNLEQSMKDRSGDTLTCVDGGGNTQSTNFNNHDALVGKVTNWVVLVEVSKTRKPSAASKGSPSTSSPSFPLPSIVSSAVSHTTQATSTGPFTPPPTPDVPKDVLVGGFGDEDLDDCEEQPATILASMSAKTPTGKSIVEIFPRPDIGAGSAQKSQKRKEPEPDYISSSEVEFMVSDLDAEGLGDEDYPMGQEEVRQTSVTAAITKPPVKKIKVEPGSVTSTGPPATTIPCSLSATASPPVTLTILTNVSDASGGSITETQCFKNTYLPPALLKDKKWRRVVTSTLFLWAASQANVFNITKSQIASALKHILPVVFLDRLQLLEGLDTNSPIVAIAYQCLCEWCHGVGSTALALMINFFAKFEADKIQEMSAMLLEHLVFLYEGLNRDDPSKAFWLHFMIELLTATHLQSIKGFVHVPALNTHALLECAVRLINWGKIDLTQNNVKGKGTVKTPLKLNKGCAKESNAAHAFSDQNLGDRARKLTISAGNCTATQLEAILELAEVSLLPPLELSDDDLRVVESDEEYALLFYCSYPYTTSRYLNCHFFVLANGTSYFPFTYPDLIITFCVLTSY
ncbi:hypothetical protein PAXINDRAFT_153728 [Paxillus involutus ATCC 200175]|nr:hypothetical protein PAXINDRAFT_153728 [Paxillus involutus ATCC 200175]